MAGAGQIYCCDTSSLIHAWRRAYPPKSFRTFWSRIESLMEEGRLVSSIEVYGELERKDDDVFAWAKAHKPVFLEIDEDVQDAMLFVMAKYPRLVDTVKGKSGADPFVIAQALSANSNLIVLHQESGGSLKSPKIPFVCEQEGVRHIDLLTLIDEEGWIF